MMIIPNPKLSYRFVILHRYYLLLCTTHSAGKEYTIFVGNLPKTIKQKDLRVMFSKYGTIQTIRLRTNTGLKMFNKKVLSKVPSLNAYVVYNSKEEMEQACQLDGEMVSNNRIRVCPADKKQIGDAKATVFVGNIARGNVAFRWKGKEVTVHTKAN